MRRSFEIAFYIFNVLLFFSVVSDMGGKPITFKNAASLLLFLGLAFSNLFLAVDLIRETIKEGMTPEPTGKTAENFKRV